MISAFVLIKAESGRVTDLASALADVEGVAEVYSVTGDHDLDEAIYLSDRVVLEPGDLICTGSPYGNGSAYGVFLKPGDLIEATIEGLGSQRNRCVAEA